MGQRLVGVTDLVIYPKENVYEKEFYQMKESCHRIKEDLLNSTEK